MEKVNGQAGAEIEITKEMLRAGAEAMRYYNDDYEDAEFGAERVYIAMVEAKENHPQM